MSHASGEVIKNKKVVGYFEYNGTSDIVFPKIRDTLQEVSDNWREEDPFDRKCTCNNPHDEVIIWSSYGAGFYWGGQACLVCRVITSEFNMEFVRNVKRGYPKGVRE